MQCKKNGHLFCSKLINKMQRREKKMSKANLVRKKEKESMTENMEVKKKKKTKRKRKTDFI